MSKEKLNLLNIKKHFSYNYHKEKHLIRLSDFKKRRLFQEDYKIIKFTSQRDYYKNNIIFNNAYFLIWTNKNFVKKFLKIPDINIYIYATSTYITQKKTGGILLIPIHAIFTLPIKKSNKF